MSAEAKVCPLKADQWTALKFVEQRPYNHDSRFFRFALEEGQALNLPVASCVIVRAPVGEDGAQVIRPYTPVSDSDTVGHLELLVKVYANGKMGQHLASLKAGDTLEFKGPFVKVPYSAQYKRRIGMLAGGSGITPMLQVLNEAAKDASDETEITLVYANRTPADILVRERLDEIAAAKPNVKVHLFVSGGAEAGSFPGQVGRIGKADIERLMPAHAEDSVVFVCGPPPFMAAISGDKLPDKSQGPLTGYLKELGYTEESVFKF